ncbi:MAG: CPBP family intramembrane metalloprotease [Treponema sp.]|nr:CPBP family intramembrane metalloprotease [Treponema sp.]
MGIYIEALIIYAVLFFSGSTGLFIRGVEGFSNTAELTRLLTYTIPSLALIWYLLLKVKKIKDWNIKPCFNDLVSGIITFPCLLITGFAVAVMASNLSGNSAYISPYFPSSVPGWAILSVSCIVSAYLEESFFRFYILSRREEMHLNSAMALVFSVALFSICHIYEGPWGFLNSVFAGTILAFIFLRYNSLHGAAIAHGFYNIAVYAIYAILN